MSGLEQDTLGGFNSMIERQKKGYGEVNVTTILFDNEYEVLHDRINMREIAPMTEKNYYVGGTTSLYCSDNEGTKLNYRAISSAVSEFREGRNINSSWKKEIDKDYTKRSSKR
jgi:hypothetical protein